MAMANGSVKVLAIKAWCGVVAVTPFFFVVCTLYGKVVKRSAPYFRMYFRDLTLSPLHSSFFPSNFHFFIKA